MIGKILVGVLASAVFFPVRKRVKDLQEMNPLELAAHFSQLNSKWYDTGYINGRNAPPASERPEARHNYDLGYNRGLADRKKLH